MAPRKSSNMRSQRRNAASRPIIGPRDLDAQITKGSPTPPNHKYNAVITRKTRLVLAWNNAGTTSFNFAAVDIIAQDKTDYNPGGASRFLQLRISRAEVWVSNLTLASTVAGSNAYVTVTDGPSGAEFRDNFNPGVDYAHVAMRPALFTRSTWRPSSDTLVLLNVAVLGTVAGESGSIIIDVTFDAC